MALRMNFDESQLMTVTNRHELFEGTRYAESEFSFKVKPLTRTTLAILAKRNTTRENGRTVLDTDAQAAAVFVKCVTDWSGIESDDGKPISCSAVQRENVAEFYIELASIVGAAALNRFNLNEVDKRADRKNSKGSGGGD